MIEISLQKIDPWQLKSYRKLGFFFFFFKQDVRNSDSRFFKALGWLSLDWNFKVQKSLGCSWVCYAVSCYILSHPIFLEPPCFGCWFILNAWPRSFVTVYFQLFENGVDMPYIFFIFFIHQLAKKGEQFIDLPYVEGMDVSFSVTHCHEWGKRVMLEIY